MWKTVLACTILCNNVFKHRIFLCGKKKGNKKRIERVRRVRHGRDIQRPVEQRLAAPLVEEGKGSCDLGLQGLKKIIIMSKDVTRFLGSQQVESCKSHDCRGHSASKCNGPGAKQLLQQLDPVVQDRCVLENA